MDSLPKDVFFKILERTTPDDLSNVCSTNKAFNRFCKEHLEYIAWYYLRKYQVEYLDPTNFIYVANNVNSSDYTSDIVGYGFNDVSTTDSNGNKVIPDYLYSNIFKLYMKNFFKQNIKFEEKGDKSWTDKWNNC